MTSSEELATNLARAAEIGLQQHTPAPWRTQGWVSTWAYIPVHDAHHNLVCSVYPSRTCSREEALGNARLITAAPDLLAALQDCAEALAFARDKLGMCGDGDGKDRKADADDTIGSLPALLAARAAIAKASGIHETERPEEVSQREALR